MNAAASRHDREQRREKYRQRHGGQQQHHGLRRGRLRQQPAQPQRRQGEAGQQRAPQVVQHLAQADRRHRAALPLVAQHPGQQLPVAARPAMLAPRSDVVTRRKLLDHLDVGSQSGAREHAFEQVVAEQRVVRHAAGQRGFERVDVIDALAGVRAFAEQVLIDVGCGRGVRIDPAGGREQPLIQRPFAADRQRGRHARLQDGVSADHPLQLVAEARPVQRVRHLADQSRCGVAWQARVGVQRDDVTHTLGQWRHTGIGRDEAGVGGPSQQPVEFVQLAAFALPSHPFVLAGVKDASPVQQEKTCGAAGPGAVAKIELRDGLASDGQQLRVARAGLLVGIEPVGQQGEQQVAAGAAQMMHFEALDLLQQIGLAGQKGGYRDQRTQVGRNTFAQRQCRQGDCAETPVSHPVDEPRGCSRCRNERHQRQGNEPARRQSRQGPQCECEQDAGQQQGCADVAADAQPEVQSRDGQRQRRLETDGGFQIEPAFGDQVIAGIPRAFRLRSVARSSRHPARGLQRADGDIELAQRRAARQLLDRAAIQVARGEVHLAEGAAATQAFVHQADVLEQLGPVDVRDQPHAGDDVAHRDVGGALALLDMFHHLVDRGALHGEPFAEPAQRRRGPRIVVPQPLGDLRGEQFRQRTGIARGDVGLERGMRLPRSEQAIRQRLGVVALAQPFGDLVGEPAQVFDQHDAKGDRHGPQLADGERLHPLVGGNEAPQRQRIEMAVGVCNEGPGDPEHARVAGEGPRRQLRQLPVIAGRQVIADLADLLFDQVIVIQQPLGGRHHAAAAFQFGGAGTIGSQQNHSVVVQTPLQRQHRRRCRRDRLGGGKAQRMLFQPLDTEEFLPDGRRVIPRRRWRAAPEGPILQPGP